MCLSWSLSLCTCACLHASTSVYSSRSISLHPHPPSLSICAWVNLSVFVHMPLYMQVHWSIHLDPSLPPPPPPSLHKYLCWSLSRPDLCLSHSPLTCRFLGNNLVLWLQRQTAALFVDSHDTEQVGRALQKLCGHACQCLVVHGRHLGPSGLANVPFLDDVSGEWWATIRLGWFPGEWRAVSGDVGGNQGPLWWWGFVWGRKSDRWC